MQSQLEQLLPFLHDKNPQVRQVALENLIGHTLKGSPNRGIFLQGIGGGLVAKDTTLIRDLKLLCRDQPSIAHDAFKALINLSDSALLAPSLSEVPFLTFLVSYIANPSSLLADLASMLLSNLAAFPIAARALLDLSIPLIPLPSPSSTPTNVETILRSFTPSSYYAPQSRCMTSSPPLHYPIAEPSDVSAVLVLVDAFAQAACAADPNISTGGTDTKGAPASTEPNKRKGELHFLASVFANISALPAARQVFLKLAPSNIVEKDKNLTPLEYPLNKLLAFSDHPNTIRRGGVASTIKNCAFDTSNHEILLLSEKSTIREDACEENTPSGVNVLPAILLPLAGPEELDLDEMELLPSALQFLPPTKRREPDPVLRRTHIETLLLLCTTRKGRDHLRDNGVYLIVRALHLVETDENVAEHVVRLVNILKRDEGPETRKEGSEEWSGTGRVEKEENESDEDEKVMEI